MSMSKVVKANMRQAYKMLRLGERYTPARLNAACRKALAVDLIDVRRLECILVEALEAEAIPMENTLAPPPGRFARPGNVFAIRGNQNGNQNKGGLHEYHH